MKQTVWFISPFNALYTNNVVVTVWLCFFLQSWWQLHRRWRLCCSQCSPAGV